MRKNQGADRQLIERTVRSRAGDVARRNGLLPQALHFRSIHAARPQGARTAGKLKATSGSEPSLRCLHRLYYHPEIVKEGPHRALVQDERLLVAGISGHEYAFERREPVLRVEQFECSDAADVVLL